MKKPELLAPAGNRTSLVAAVQNGADAVYLGGQHFNARRNAENFSDIELAGIIEYAHARDVKVYVTVNILVADTELYDAVRFLNTIQNAGADAVIIQDLGLIRLARRVIPELELHASTQMTAHNVHGVKFLQDVGIDKVVLARELGLEEISEIKERTGAILETFIHGALCISYSGQCLMSSMIGGRSGNRGRCAQPCRLEYRLIDNHGKQLSDPENTGEYLLSPRDLNLSNYIPELIRAGIDSFKIEGRMRRPEYVATVTRIYRALIDRAMSRNGYTVKKDEAYEIEQIFSRGFTSGYYFGVPGSDLMSYKRPNNRGVRLGRVRKYERETKRAIIELEAPLNAGDGIEVWVTRGGRVGTEVNEMFKSGQTIESAFPGDIVELRLDGHIYPGDRVFKTSDIKTLEKAVQTYSSERETKKIPLSFSVRARLGKPLSIEASDNNGVSAVTYTNSICEEARNRPLTIQFLSEQLDRLGNTPFFMSNLDSDLEGEVMVPVREINEARRQVVEEVLYKKIGKRKPAPVSIASVENKLSQELNETINFSSVGSINKFPRLAVSVNNVEGVKAAVNNGAEIIYFGGEAYRSQGKITIDDVRKARKNCSNAGVKFYLGTPRIIHNEEIKKYLAFLSQALECKPDGIMVASYGLMKAIKDISGFHLVTDFNLNVFNRHSAIFLRENGVERVTLSPELTGEQIKNLVFGMDIETEIIAQGVIPLMISRHFAVGSILGEKTRDRSCEVPCHDSSFALLDRKGIIFPVETDKNCLMHIFNSRELSLLDTLPTLTETGVGVLRIEARREKTKYIIKTVQTYRRVLDIIRKDGNENLNLSDIMNELNEDGPGYTRGHYYRGVLE